MAQFGLTPRCQFKTPSASLGPGSTTVAPTTPCCCLACVWGMQLHQHHREKCQEYPKKLLAYHITAGFLPAVISTNDTGTINTYRVASALFW